MSYILGLDLGTTSTAAAVNDGQAVRIFSHPSGATAIPSVLALEETGSWLVGEAAIRHASLDPSAIAREFKRRFGDPTPLLLRGTPVAANDLTLRLAQHVVAEVSGQIGEAPTELVVCHPANWGDFKTSLLSDTLANSALPPHRLLSEPHAAAIHYSGLERVADDTVVAVYDLGGGTFDAAVLRRVAATDPTWEMVGTPGGIERLGGIDFDTAVFQHVLAGAEIDVESLDDDDPSTQLAVARLRADCRQAKTLLSSEQAATIAVSLPGVETSVRLTRVEFEAMIAPALDRTLEAFDVTLANAGVRSDDVDRLLLVGGSSRIPLVAQRLTAHTGRPITVDAHPKNTIALGAAGSVEPAEVEAASPGPVAGEGLDTGRTMVLPENVLGADLRSDQSVSGEVPLGTNFPAVPNMADEPPPEFLARRGGSGGAVPAAEPPPTQPLPRAVTQPLGPPAEPQPAVAPAPAVRTPATQNTTPAQPPQRERPAGRSRFIYLLAPLLLAASAIGGYLVVDQIRSNDTSAGTTSTTTEAATSTTSPSTTEAPISTAAVDQVVGNCSAGDGPDPEQTYRVVFIPADDPDGGLNGRAAPSLDSEVVSVFASESPVKVTGEHCEVDESGRVWWGARAVGELVWVAARFLEPL